MWDRYCNVSVLKGKTLSKVVASDEVIVFTTTNGEVYKMYHEQDCCESVYVESITGDLDDLVGEEILVAEDSQNLFDLIKDFDKEEDDYSDSHTWTFYKFATFKGYVDIRWYGSSNGYYSESVEFIKEK